MVSGRACKQRLEDGRTCGAPPGLESEFCFWHDPARSEEVAEARRLGGQRRRRERVVAGAFEFNGLAATSDLRRILEIAVIDVLGLENSVARARALSSLVSTAAKLLETGEFEERLAQLECVLEPRAVKAGKGRR
jgi:hypothetical protein